MSPPRPEVLAFLQDIKQNPDDDTPRLIFADWLEENNDPRGEFMRIQCELTQMTAKDRRHTALQKRETELLTAHRVDWLGPLTAWHLPDITFSRGLIQLRIATVVFLDRLEKQRKNWPTEHLEWIEHITFLLTTRENLLQLAVVPIACQLTAIRLQRAINNRVSLADILAGSPAFTNLVSLELFDFDVDDSDLLRLTESPYLKRMKKLHLVDNSIRGAGLSGLSQLRELESLELSRNQLGDDGTLPLRDIALPRLTHLALDFNRVTDKGIQALARSSSLTSLRTLSLKGNLIGSTGAAALAAAPALTNLRTLTLSQNLIGAKGADALAASPYLKQLTVLDLQGNVLPDAKKTILKERFGNALRL